MNYFLSVSVAIVAGLMLTRFTNLFKLPDVTAYLIAGVLIGPYALGRLGVPGLGFPTMADVEYLSFISNAALGFIAFAIGNEFRLSQLRQTGRPAAIVGVFQAVITTVIVDIALIGLHFVLGDKLPIPAAVTLGAIASATAPAATLMVVRQFKAKGPLTDLLLPVVALDDAVGLGLFAVSFGIAQALQGGVLNMASIVLEPLLEIILSLGLGALAGFALAQLEKIFHSGTNRLSLIVGFVLMAVALSMLKFEVCGIHIGFSSLLVCMMLGTIFCNLCPFSEEMMGRAERWTAPLYLLFFVISGAELEIGAFSDIVVVGIGTAFILTRCLGKYYGAYISAAVAGCEDSIKKYLGITLFPQAGVALGMCVTASTLKDGAGDLVRNIVLFAVLIYELVGPVLTKMALTAAGDIKPEGRRSARGSKAKG